AYVLKSARCPVVPIGDDHPVPDDDGPHLPSLAIGKFSPFQGHPQIGLIVFFLFSLLHKVGLFDPWSFGPSDRYRFGSFPFGSLLGQAVAHWPDTLASRFPRGE